MSKEVVELTKSIEESKLFWECSQIAFEMEINNLRVRISEMETQYEVRMENAANDRESLQNKLIKAKDDLVNNRARIPMFHERIAEVQHIIAKQEAELMDEMVIAKMNLS